MAVNVLMVTFISGTLKWALASFKRILDTKARRLLPDIYCLIFWAYFKWKELRSTGTAAVNVSNLSLCFTKCFARGPFLVLNINHRYSYLCWRKYNVQIIVIEN